MDATPTWAGAAVIALGLIGAWLRRRWKHRDAEADRARKVLEAARCSLCSAVDAMIDAREDGFSATDLYEATQEYEAALAAYVEARETARRLGVATLAALVLGACAGCRSPAPAEPTVLDDHVRIVAPGDVVPPLPSGQTRWWLCTPRGLSMVAPTREPIR